MLFASYKNQRYYYFSPFNFSNFASSAERGTEKERSENSDIFKKYFLRLQKVDQWHWNLTASTYKHKIFFISKSPVYLAVQTILYNNETPQKWHSLFRYQRFSIETCLTSIFSTLAKATHAVCCCILPCVLCCTHICNMLYATLASSSATFELHFHSRVLTTTASKKSHFDTRASAQLRVTSTHFVYIHLRRFATRRRRGARCKRKRRVQLAVR